MRLCIVCNHPEKRAIEAAIEAGESSRRVQSRFGVEHQAVNRHRRNHMTAPASKRKASTLQLSFAEKLSPEPIEEGPDVTLLERARRRLALADRLVAYAEKMVQGSEDKPELQAQAIRVACGALRESRGFLETLGRITGEIRQHQSVEHSGRVETVTTTNKLSEPELVTKADELQQRLRLVGGTG